MSAPRKGPRLVTRLLAGALALGTTGSGVAVLAQSLSPELQALDAKLPGHLVNDPTRIDWANQGSDLKVKGVQDASIPGGGAARRYTVAKKPANPWEAQTFVPLTAPIERGQVLTIGFYARAISAETDDGKGVIGVRFQQNSAPYPGFGDKAVRVGKDWQWYEVSGTADRAIARDVAIVALQLGGAQQEIEIGQTIVVAGAASIASAGGSAAVQPAAEAAIPEPLKGNGALINRPDQRGWGVSGDAGTSEEREDRTIWLGKSTRFTVTRVGENPWDFGAAIPIEGAIAEGDRLTVAIAARAESAETEDGLGFVGARIQDGKPPYEGFAESKFAVGPKWQVVRIRTTAPRAFAAGEAQLALHLAGAVQVVDIGPVYVFRNDAEQ